ncbi:TolC family protein [Chryseolinea sp. H1M3-3]|uniref:TolC family protein n=1 Tax=Chryseolinea sp. H1M3-3 TaxID=3034144 RepID=UPI0023EDC160|nr:TolC family protein [Chryseolinea sp. H1M3-3]
MQTLHFRRTTHYRDMTPRSKLLLIMFFLSMLSHHVSGQDVLTMQEALTLGVMNYGTIKSKTFQVQSSQHALSQAKREYLPNIVLSAQQTYGTINGQNGPLYGFGGFGVGSSGLPLPEQNWNAAFGALYLANINWEVFTFGRARGRIQVARATQAIAARDLEQEQFQHQVRVAAAYLNVLGTQRLAAAQQKNLARAEVVQRSVSARAKGGLVAGVDSALANAEVANARIALLRALDFQQEEEKKLVLLLGTVGSNTPLDSSFAFITPALEPKDTSVISSHPILNFYQSRVQQSQAQINLSRKSYFPSLSLVGIFQARASGFEAQYVQDQTAFTHSYGDGISPTRANYLVGIGLTWNLTSLMRTNAQVKSLSYLNMAAQAELELASQEINTQTQIANAKLSNALHIQQEAPIQVQSATDAYTQKSALYRNGLTTLVDVTQTLYALNRAETDRDLAFINVWQALLLKAAATGDLNLFTNELTR